MNFLTMALTFIIGLSFLLSASHVKSNKISKFLYCIGTFGIVMAMYIAWPK
ncbi:hypothetical protein M5C72_08965 [Companilactobacillus allii]|uniref:hypothetical protein n=1 Tax=Companilactobacillus allii TaxID=1847728 RepID=UPI0012FF6D97|nr:hypothetical protein [Companilactobacillus allii]USQ68008.1 hypothetical protein M5C72_08965 [Companilactobacillus allii]